MGERVQVGVAASTPGGDSNTYNMFNSVTTFGGGQLNVRGGGVSRLEFSTVNDQAGTLKFYRSYDKGTNWDQVGGDIAVPASGTTDISGPYDYLCDPYPDVKLDWVNGGVAQTTWRPVVVLVCGDRAAAV